MNKEVDDTDFGNIDTVLKVATTRTKMSLDHPKERYNTNYKLLMGKDSSNHLLY